VAIDPGSPFATCCRAIHTRRNKFPRQLLKARDYLREVESGLERLRDRPALILSGTRDVAFRAAARRRFERALPNHRTVLLPGVGRCVQEDATAEVADAIGTWHPLLAPVPA
jgi:haloalkane dehalogenase